MLNTTTLDTAVSLPLSHSRRSHLTSNRSSAIPANLDLTRLSSEAAVAHVMNGYDDYVHDRLNSWDDTVGEILEKIDNGTI